MHSYNLSGLTVNKGAFHALTFKPQRFSLFAWVCVCVRACVRARVRACVRACARARVCLFDFIYYHYLSLSLLLMLILILLLFALLLCETRLVLNLLLLFCMSDV